MPTTIFQEQLQSLLADLGVIALVCDLIRAPSYIGLPRQEEKVVAVLEKYFEKNGVDFSIAEIRPGRPNLSAVVQSPKPGAHLILCGHTDTVAPNKIMAMDPFGAEIRDGRIYGRGAVDMKGAVAAMAAALVALKKLQLLERGAVTLAAVIDEEMESLGAEALIRNGITADGAIVGEPTRNQIAIGHKGLEWLEIEFLGKATHGGTPEKGVNAISAAARFVRMIEEELVPQFQTRRHAVLGPPTINMGTIHGGDQPSTVAARCTIQLDRRWVPMENIEQVFGELEEILSRVREAMPGLSTDLRRVAGGMATMVHGPLEIAENHALVRAAQQARAAIYGDAGVLTSFPAWTDAALLSREANIPCIVCGPGDLSLAHSAEESIAITEVEEAVYFYVAAARYFLGNA
ncbi:MAG: M20 family metallopeptidase [candidate division KSB1 bacterium]|nr:M20 family metallopeptidase [candidate division KSB1 bacterium]MDZ7402963.1 M20 family metallopeptidase [candidate division KSB1 bacterium]